MVLIPLRTRTATQAKASAVPARPEWQKLVDEGRSAAAYPLLLQAAKQGNVHAQVELGYDLAYGISRPPDERRARKWWKRAYRQGSWAAAFHLGAFFRDSMRFTKAARWFGRAAHAGDPDAFVELAAIHLHYRGDPEKAQAALQAATASKRKLTPLAQNQLEALLREQSATTPEDLLYNEAEGLDEDGYFAETFAILTRLAASNYAPAQLLLGNYLTEGKPGVPPDISAGKSWYEKAFAQGDATAAENLALQFHHEGDIEAAMLWLGRSADCGNPDAHLLLARLWLSEKGSTKKARQHLTALFAARKQASEGALDAARVLYRQLS